MTLITRDTAEAARLMRAGELVAFPTETVYGLGADATNDQAVARVFDAKGRPSFNPLIVHVASLEEARGIGELDATARKLAAAFWPGPLTLVVPQRPGSPVSALATTGLPSVALRLPAHPVARELLLKVGRPVVAPSANQSGRLSPTRAEHVLDSLAGRISAIVDAGATPIGIESTIVACLGAAPGLLRPGGIARETIEALLAAPLADAAADPERPESPGQLLSHYAPRAALRLNILAPEPDEALLAFGPPPVHSGPLINLSARGDLVEAAATLFRALHEFDASGVGRIAVMPIPMTGLGLAINDRLRRAAVRRKP